MTTRREVNEALCRALGLDPATTMRVEIVLSPLDFPSIKVQRRITDAVSDKLQTAIEALHLKLIPEGFRLATDEEVGGP